MQDPEEFGRLLEIFNRYPVRELIIHPRLQKDFYKNTPNQDVFAEAFISSRNAVCYNGDIFTGEDYKRFEKRFPEVTSIMIGRGVLADPSLARQIRGGAGANKEELKKFHDILYREYCQEMSGDRTILYKMKEMWTYMAPLFTNSKKYAKKIKKSEKCAVYEEVVNELFAEEDVVNG